MHDMNGNELIGNRSQIIETDETIVGNETTTNEFESPYKDEVRLQDAKDDSKVVVIPTDVYNKIRQLNKDISMLTEEEIEKYLSEDDKAALELASNGLLSVSQQDIFNDKVKENWDQNLKEDGKEVKIKELAVRTDNLKGVLSGKKALVKLNEFLGLSNEIQIPLFHSGFHIMLNVLKEKDIISLVTKLTRNKIELGKNTTGLAFSNESVLFSRIILDFVIEHMHSTTLKLSEDDDIRDYIMAPDIYIMAIAILRSIEPRGFNITRTCHNAIETDENIKPKCNYILKAKIDLEKVVYVDKDNMSDFHRKLLLKRSPNSVTKDEVNEYQNTLSVLQPKDYSISIDDTRSIVMTLKTPKIVDNIEAGELWISDIEEIVEDQFSNIEDVSDEERYELIMQTTQSTMLNRYLHYVDAIHIDDSVIKDRASIYEALNQISTIGDLYNDITNLFKEFVDNNVIYVIGIPQYTCPECRESMDYMEGNFKEIIPLNVYYYFLESCTLKLYEMAKRTENI